MQTGLEPAASLFGNAYIASSHLSGRACQDSTTAFLYELPRLSPYLKGTRLYHHHTIHLLGKLSYKLSGKPWRLTGNNVGVQRSNIVLQASLGRY